MLLFSTYGRGSASMGLEFSRSVQSSNPRGVLRFALKTRKCHQHIEVQKLWI